MIDYAQDGAGANGAKPFRRRHRLLMDRIGSFVIGDQDVEAEHRSIATADIFCGIANLESVPSITNCCHCDYAPCLKYDRTSTTRK